MSEVPATTAPVVPPARAKELALVVCDELAAAGQLPTPTEVHARVRDRKPGSNPSLLTIQKAIAEWKTDRLPALFAQRQMFQSLGPDDVQAASEIVGKLFSHAMSAAQRSLATERAIAAGQVAEMSSDVAAAQGAAMRAEAARDVAIAEIETAREREIALHDEVGKLKAQVAANAVTIAHLEQSLEQSRQAHDREIDGLRAAAAGLERARKDAMLEKDSALTARHRAEEGERRERDNSKTLQTTIDTLRGRANQQAEESARQRGRAEVLAEQVANMETALSRMREKIAAEDRASVALRQVLRRAKLRAAKRRAKRRSE